MSFSLLPRRLISHTLARTTHLRGEIRRETRKAISEARHPHAGPAAHPHAKDRFDAHKPARMELNPKERGAMRDLTPHERSQFERVQKKVPQAQRHDLNHLLVSGKLINHEDSRGNTLLDHLARLGSANTDLHQGIGRKALLGDLVSETAHPTSMDQGDKNAFCGATAAEYGLASRNPAEYARLVTGLAQHGKVQLEGQGGAAGPMLKIDPALDPNANGGRSLCQQLLAQPLSALATGTGVTEHGRVMANQKASGADGKSTQYGLYGDQVADAQSAMTGHPYRPASMPREASANYDRAQVAARALIRQQAEHGAHPAVLVGHHWVSVSHVEQGRVTVVNEHGKTVVRPLDDLIRHAREMTYDARYSNPPPALNFERRGGPGGGWNPASGTTPPKTRI